MSIPTLLALKRPYFDYLDLQTDIRAKQTPTPFLGFWVPTNNTVHAITPWFREIAQQPRGHSEANCKDTILVVPIFFGMFSFEY
jgi:hypothetical protein